jgi:glycine/D-amino acid oxidase-like deaminating enzyme/nitrite reductase/ring-hydroxylating ferredoxin subunit
VNTTPYWFDTAQIRNFPSVTEDLNVDVLVVGAGITGITAAYLLKREGLTVALIDRDGIAMIDTGHTTAHLTHVTDTRLSELVKEFGRDGAQAAWDANAAGIDQIEEIVRNEAIDCEFTRVPGYLHAPTNGGTRDERPSLREDADYATEFGFDATFIESIPFMNTPGVRFANQGKIHPRKYLAKLVALIPGGGSHVFEKSDASEFDADGHRAKVNGHWISYGRVVLATHNPVLGEAAVTTMTLFQTKLAPYSTYAMGAKIPRGSVPIACYWDTNDPYYYLRVEHYDDYDYAIYGGEDEKTGQIANTERSFNQLEAAFKGLIAEAQIDHRWTGQVIETNDGLPFIGPNTDRQFISTGYTGNGTTFGTLGAMMARDWAVGVNNPWAKLFDPHRKKIKGGTLEYILENKDYPYYLIKGRFDRAEGKSLDAVKPGEGKILKLDGKKCAVFRDADGNVTKLSAVCTHMGCIVKWNDADATWDCPCHGSRFEPTGKPRSGPAEAPLNPV